MIISSPDQLSAPTRGFVVFEGVNGAGKSTAISSLAHKLAATGVTTCVTREPGGTPFGREVRRLVQESPQFEITSTAELLLFGADRAYHRERVIEVALERQDLVLCDRYLYSSAAFQGYGREIDQEKIALINNLAVANTLPDLVVLLDLPPAQGLARGQARSHNPADSFEAQDLAFHERVRSGFLELARTRAEAFIVVNACLSQEQVVNQIEPYISAVVNNRLKPGVPR